MYTSKGFIILHQNYANHLNIFFLTLHKASNFALQEICFEISRYESTSYTSFRGVSLSVGTQERNLSMFQIWKKKVFGHEQEVTEQN